MYSIYYIPVLIICLVAFIGTMWIGFTLQNNYRRKKSFLLLSSFYTVLIIVVTGICIYLVL